MKRTGRLSLLTLILLFGWVTVASSQTPSSRPPSPRSAASRTAAAQPQASTEPIMVGRISEVEGQLLRYVPAEKDWVATIKDAPFGLDDALYSDQDGKAEFIMPNGTWIRVGADTQIQLIALRRDVSEIDVASGVSRFFNKSQDAMIKTTTPFGYVVAPAGTTFDLYVGDESVEVIAISGTVDFVLNNDAAKYQVAAGSPSLLSDGKAVEDGAGTVDADWDDWNAARDELWTKKITVKGASTQYLPPNLSDDSYDLDQNGSWETVDYEGQQRTMWRPTTVDNDWAPFTRGRWTEWNDDNCWVPEEPFGYVTHHYGNWVRVESCGCWYWAPPMPRVQVVAEPVYDPCTCWYPGRVAWISSGVDIGWVPLAPLEPYYSHRYWGPRAMVVAGVGFAGININIGSYRWLNSAVIVNQNNFYGVNNYSRVRITNINQTTIINNYRGHAVVNERVMSNYRNNRQRFNFNNDIRVTNKPHGDVVRRIDSNRRIAGQTRNVNASGIERRVSGVKEGQLAKGARIKNPSITNKIVPAGDVNKPRKEIASQRIGLKKNERQPREVQTGNRGTQGQRGEQGKGGIKSPRGTGQVQGQPSTREQRQQLQQEKRQQQQSPRQQQMEQRKQQQQSQKQQQMEKQNQRQQQQQQQRERQQNQRQQQMEQRKQQQQNQKQQQMERQNQRQQQQQQQREKQQSQRQQQMEQRKQQQQNQKQQQMERQNQRQQVQQQRQQQQREKQQSQRQQVQQQRQQQQQQKQQVQQQRQQQQQQKRQQSQQGQKRKSQEIQ